MKKLTVLLLMLGGMIAPSLVIASPAEAARNRTPGCVTKAEYRKIKGGMTSARVKRIIGAQGKLETESRYTDWVDTSYWQGYGDHDESGTYVGDGNGDWEMAYDPDLGGEYLEYVGGDYVDDGEWATTIYATRSFKKCRSWNNGMRVWVSFDNTTFDASGMRVTSKFR